MFFAGNNISTNGTNSFAVFLASNSRHSIFTNTVFDNPVQWISTSVAAANNTFINTLFDAGPASLRYAGAFNVTGTRDLNTSNVVLAPNNITVNSTLLPALNISAQLTLRNLTFANPRPTVDETDSGIFSFCGTARCTEISFNSGIFIFNVTRFTGYSSEETPSGGISVAGGGGGGSGSRAYAQSRWGRLATRPLTVNTAGIVKLVNPGIEYTYTIAGVESSAFVASLGSGEVVLEFNPGVEQVHLKIGDIFKQDVNQDGVYDLSVEILVMSLIGATMEFKAISEPVKTPAPAVSP